MSPSSNKPWLQNWPSKIPKSINYPTSPLHGLLQQTAKKYPKQTAIVCHYEEISYSKLDELSNRFANALISLGVEKGDRVAIYLPNIAEFIVAYFGISKSGAVVTTINPLNREREVEYQLCDSETQTIVASDTLFPNLKSAWTKTMLKNIILTKEAGETVCNKPNVCVFQQLLDEASLKQPDMTINAKEDLALLQYTGGTTGTPKAAMLTHANMVSNAISFAAWIKGSTAQETFLTALPLSHIYGMTTSMNVPISLAAKTVLMPKFEPIKVFETIQQQKVTVFCGVPTMYLALLANPEVDKYDLTSIRVCISGASPLPLSVQKQFKTVTGGLLVEGYGLTEGSPVTHCNPVDRTMPMKAGSIGFPLPDTEALIVDLETGTKTLEAGQVGELAVKGPQVMVGYWKKPAETVLVLRDGWLLTGDIAYMDGEGYFYITDRKKDLIKTRGYSVYPSELEDILYEYPAVKLCTVIGKPHPQAGEIPKAYIVLKEGATVSNQEIMAFVNNQVASYKAIREVEFRKELPVSSAGKVLRRLLQDTL